MSNFITDKNKIPIGKVTSEFLNNMHDSQIMDEFKKQYNDMIDTGKKEAKNSTIAVVSISRNSAESLQGEIL